MLPVISRLQQPITHTLRSHKVLQLCHRYYDMSKELISSKERVLKSSTAIRYAKVPQAFYGGRHLITMLPGGGIGPEMMEHVLDVIAVTKSPIDFEVIEITRENYTSDLEYAIMSIRRNGAGIKAGSIEDNGISIHIPSANVELRRKLDLYISLTECRPMAGIKSKIHELDIVVVRQNTEGEYAMLEHENKRGVVESMKIITRYNSQRLAKWLFQYCMDQGRKKITIVHKANIMKLSDGLFLRTIKEMGAQYPELTINDVIVDNCCMQLIKNPKQFDVLVTPNLYGSIVTNVICGLVGGAGISSGKNYGDDYALFETATRNSYSAMTGRNIANPISILHVTADLLFHLGHEHRARVIRAAVARTITEGINTVDVGGTASSSEVMARIKEHITDTLEI